MTDNKKVFKSQNFEIKSSDEEKRIIEAIGSKEVVDRDREVIKVEGIDLKNYKKNPVVLFAHNSRELPVARAERVWVDKETKSLMFKLQFPEPEVSSFADTTYKLMKAGFLNTLSIGFIPDYESVEYNEKTQVRTFHKSELLEVSLVPVPANPAAVVTAKGLQRAVDEEVIDELELKDFESHIKELDVEVVDKDLPTETEHTIETVEKTKEDLFLEIDEIIKEVDTKISQNPTYLDSILEDLFVEVSDAKSQDTKTQTKAEDDLDKFINDILE